MAFVVVIVVVFFLIPFFFSEIFTKIKTRNSLLKFKRIIINSLSGDS